ncbi:MAG: LacI family DNA-binding transcriptional regulator [Clostridia bacterium]
MSLKRIAEMVGASPSTVSRVLNNRSATCASEALKEKIWQAAHDIGYTPNQSAQFLVRGGKAEEKTPRVAVVLARIFSLSDDPFFFELYRAIEVELNRRHIVLEGIWRAGDTLEGGVGAPDGVIILGRCSAALLKRLQLVTGNLVGLWRNPLNFDVDEVIADGEKAARLAVEHLLTLGHRKIAYIGDCSYERRYVGYCDTLIKHELPINYQGIFPTDQSERAGYEAMEKLLEGGEATAVLCANDLTAVGALAAMAKNRAAKKHPLSVISIDNIDRAQATQPMLTTVNIPREDMAHMALEVLLDRMRGGHRENLRVELPCRIVVRDSCRASGAMV